MRTGIVWIIKRGALVACWQSHPDAQSSLEAWYGIVRAAKWNTPAEMKQTYPHADLVERRTVFNIAGNKYRLIARVNYQAQRVLSCSSCRTESMTEERGNHGNADD